MSLNPEQRAAAEHMHGPLLILAGAGSGKTRVITHRVGYLIDQGIAPENILAVSFTNKAAGEMKERVAQIVGKKVASEVHLSTFHALGANLLRQYIDRIGYKKPFTILDAGDQLKVLKEVIEHADLDPHEIKPKEILPIISRGKNAFCQPKDLKVMRLNPLVSYAQRLFRPYMDACKALNAVDFDDLQTLPVKLFRENPDVLQACRQLYKFVMVDEYQDTNDTQLLVLRLLCNPTNNLCVVGDDDQAIYSFRGAVTRNILEFEKHFPGARVIKLQQNYRSTTMILKAANAVVRNNVARRDKALWSALGEGEPIEYYELQDEVEEADFVASAILRGGEAGQPWSDFAILMRTARTSQFFEESLTAAGVPYKMVGGNKFFDRSEIKDIVCYLKVLLNPRDEVALRRIINTPSRGVGHTSLTRMSDYAHSHDVSMYSLIANPELIDELRPGQIEALKALHGLFEDYRRRFRGGDLEATLEQMIADIGYRDYIRQSEKSDKVARIRLDNITYLVGSLRKHEERGDKLESWVQRLALADARDNSDAGSEEAADTVTIMTLHASKGLEYPSVFLIGFEEGLLPHARSLEAGGDGDVEEERRLVYVGITRAQRRLTLTSARTRGAGTAKKRRTVSRYLEEIPAEFIRTYAHGEHEPDVRAERTRTRRNIRDIIDAIKQA